MAEADLTTSPHLQCLAPAMLLVGHGTRDPQGQRELLLMAELVRKRLPNHRVEPCFLELASPDIPQAITQLTPATEGDAIKGNRPLWVAPLLLFSAGHAKRDIPQAVRFAAANTPFAGNIHQAAHLGCSRQLLQLSALRYEEAVAKSGQIPPEQTLLVMVGRGSLDPTATAEMHEFSRLRRRLTPALATEVCFVAMAEPRFDATLQQLAEKLRSGELAQIRRVVIQPHLLFCGELLERIKTRVMQLFDSANDEPAKPSIDADSSSPEQFHPICRAVDVRRVEWIVASHLGCHPLLADAVVAKLSELPRFVK